MIKEAIGFGATVEEAVQQAKQNLNAPIEADIKIEVINREKKKILGLFGGSSAKVKVFYDDGVEETKKAPEKKKENKKTENKKANKEVKAQQPKAKEPEIDLSGIEAKETDATKYLKSILVGMGFGDANVTVKETAEDLFFEITCEEDYGNIIGRRGETLDALQYLTRLYVNRTEKENKRVALNVGDYRKRREETLKALAKRQASRAIKYRRSCVLEPMNPYERRIIHTAVQEIEGVSSHSVGEGENRRVVIVSDDCDNSKRGNYSKDRRGNNGRRERRPQYVPETPKEPREPKNETNSTFRYGKIEPKNVQGE